MLNTHNFQSKWINKIQNILTEIGRPDIWQYQNLNLHKNTKDLVNAILKDQYLQDWYSQLQNSNKGKNYSLFKESISLEKYLILLQKQDYQNLIKFRTTNHFLPIGTGRWNNIDLDDRKCQLCTKNVIGDEIHYLLDCTYFSNQRCLYLKRYCFRRPNIFKFHQLITQNPQKSKKIFQNSFK